MFKAQETPDKNCLEHVAENATRNPEILRKLRASIRAAMRGKALSTEQAKSFVAARRTKKRA